MDRLNGAVRPLKILHVGDFFFDAKKSSPSQFQTSGKINHGLIRNGHHVLPFPYREIGRQGLGKYFHFLRQAHIDNILKNFIRSARPDMVLLGKGSDIAVDTLREIRKILPGINIAQWSDDALFEGRNVQKLNEKHALCDASFISTAPALSRKTLGTERNIFFLPNPVDMSVETGRNFEQEDLPRDIFLSCGNPGDKRRICGKDWDMDAFLAFLRRKLPSETDFALAGLGGEDYASGAVYADLLKSAAIGLNISRRGDELLYSSDRMAHIIGNGLLCAQERASGFQTIFDEDEMLFFSSEEELIEKLIFFIKHPQARQKAAQKGWKKYHSLFSETAIADYLIRASFGFLKVDEHVWHRLV